MVRLLVESSAATISALTVAPAISIVDKAIVSNASGLEPLVPCLINGVKSFLLNPFAFCKQPSFLFIWGVYSGTYIVANSIEAICQRNQSSPLVPKFIGSSVANVSLSVLKDRAFARMFGTGNPKPMPAGGKKLHVDMNEAIVHLLISRKGMALFATRDSMTILASFTLPDTISLQMQQHLRLQRGCAVAQLCDQRCDVAPHHHNASAHLTDLLLCYC